MRKTTINRNTKETCIDLTFNLDGSGKSNISTGIGFLDHMLELFVFHGNFDLDLKVVGDIDVDSHHTTEDLGLVLGQAIKVCLGDKLGINRYGMTYLPMDETLARVVLDLSGRPYLVYDCSFDTSDLNTLGVQNIKEFFKSVSNTSLMTLHLSVLYGENDHHKAEAVFKGFGRALKEAVEITSQNIMSTKGVL